MCLDEIIQIYTVKQQQSANKYHALFTLKEQSFKTSRKYHKSEPTSLFKTENCFLYQEELN